MAARGLLVAFLVVGAALSQRSVAIARDFNPKDYGSCVWDGNHDVAPCIQLAIDEAVRQGVVVTIPSGKWPLSRPLALPSKTRLRGEDSSTTLIPTDDNASKPILLVVNTGENIRVENLVFDGGGPDFATRNPVVAVNRGHDVRFDHIIVRNSHGIGLLMQAGVVGSGVVDSQFRNLGNHWKTTKSPKDRIQGVVFCCGGGNSGNFAKHDTFDDIGLDALQFTDQVEFTAEGNTFNLENNSHELISARDFPAAIFPMRTSHSLIADNLIRGAQGCGIDAPGLQDTVITKNRISDSSGCGIGLFLSYDKQMSSENVTVSDNVIVNNVRWRNSPFKGGVTISSGAPRGIRLINNTVTDTQEQKTQTFGLHVLRNTHLTDLRIDDSNKLSGNATAPIDREDDPAR